ncbi:MAG: tetratricopeptide repeat protein [Desulfobacterales bacterium]|nr:tetratricopeptide repeat protein [Desulfobacterales bacterium]
MNDFETNLNKAIQHYFKGQYDEAEIIYSKLLKIESENENLLNLAGVLYLQKGNLKKALNLLSKAVSKNSNNPDIQNNLGVVHKELKNLKEALKHFRSALNLKPDYYEAYINAGLVSKEEKNFPVAINFFERALKLKPDCYEPHFNIANCYKEQGNFNLAATFFNNSIKLSPNFYGHYNNLGNLFQEKGQYNDAILCYKNALSIKPDYPEVYYNMGICLNELALLEEAIGYFTKAIKIKPNYANAYNNLGTVYQDQGKLIQAMECYKNALRLKSDYSKAHSNLVYLMQFLPYSEKEHYIEANLWWIRHGLKLQHKYKHKKFSSKNKIRIGYISPDFKEHSVSYFLLPLLYGHNRNKFEIYCYSDVKNEDKITQLIKKISDKFQQIFTLSNEDAAELIYHDKIDILIDITGHTQNNRLLVFAMKPSFVQITWLGYPSTTGIPLIDYRITDNIADPIGDTDKYYSEKLIRLPSGFLCYDPLNNAPDISDMPAIKSNMITFCSFNNLPKINENVISVWSKILKEVANSQLMLKSRGLFDPTTRQRYYSMFKEHGIQKEKIIMLPRTHSTFEHLKNYNNADIGLDTFPYNGTTTTFEALWMGIPVITLKGKCHASRVGSSILEKLNLLELIADSEETYIKKTVQLTFNFKKISELRIQLRNILLSSNLMNAKNFATSFENALEQVINNPTTRAFKF